MAKRPKPVQTGLLQCGIIMPISEIDGCSEKHWKDVRNIIEEAVRKKGFDPLLVSESDDVGVIHRTIIQNVFKLPIVVCDVSGKNPNVMFELGMRLAFNKPVVLIKDDQTDYSFDTGIIEHLGYPRGLHFQSIVEFQRNLASKVESTYRKAQEPDFSFFLKHFGTFTVASIENAVIPRDEFLERELDEIRSLLERLTSKSERRTISQDELEAAQLFRQALVLGKSVPTNTHNQTMIDSIICTLKITPNNNAIFDRNPWLESECRAELARLMDVGKKADN